jgi:CRP-like cAMP-binding protein
MDKMSILKSTFVFKNLEDKLLHTIAGHLNEISYANGASIFKEKDKADSFYIIQNGEVTISKEFGPEHKKVLAVLGPGSIFGEMAFFSDSPRTAHATCSMDSVLLVLKRDSFMKFINDEPKAGLEILSGLLQVSMDRLEETSRELATVYQTSKIISSGKGLASVIGDTRDELMLAVPEANETCIYLYNEFNQEFDPASSSGNAPQIDLTHLLIEKIKGKPQGIIVNFKEKSDFPIEQFYSNAKTLLITPMLKEQNMLGFILLWSTTKFDAFQSSHLLLVLSVASQLAEAITNIKYQQEERDRKRLDSQRFTYEP